jgi:hypothetical protein
MPGCPPVCPAVPKSSVPPAPARAENTRLKDALTVIWGCTGINRLWDTPTGTGTRQDRLSARLDNNRQIEFNAGDHRHFDHGYAVTGIPILKEPRPSTRQNSLLVSFQCPIRSLEEEHPVLQISWACRCPATTDPSSIVQAFEMCLNFGAEGYATE